MDLSATEFDGPAFDRTRDTSVRKGTADLGLLIVVEGPDGVGKSSLVDQAVRRLHRDGITASSFSFPGRIPGSLGALVYRIHHEDVECRIDGLSPASLQMLHVAAHFDAIDRHIEPSLKTNRVVLLDRFWWSTWVYGVEAGVRVDLLRSMVECEKLQWGTIEPSLIVLLRRDAPLRSSERTQHWHHRSELYSELASHESQKSSVLIVDNTGPLEQATSEVLDHISHLID